MGNFFRISLILVTIVLSFYNLSFGDPLAKGISLMNSSNEPIYGQWMLPQRGEAPFSSPEKAWFGITRYITKPSKALSNRGFSMNPEISNTIESLATAKSQKKELSNFESNELSMGTSSYHFGKINLIKTNLEPSLNFISSLSVAHYKEENPLSWTLEKFKDTDIFKSLAILLELKLKF